MSSVFFNVGAIINNHQISRQKSCFYTFMNQTDVVTVAVRRSKTRTVIPATKQRGAQEPLKCIEPLQNIICGIHFGNVHVQIMISVLLMKICLSLRLTYIYGNFSFGICSILVIISVQYPFLSCVNTVLHAVLRFTHS